MTTGLDMASARRLQLIKETTPGVLNPAGVPRAMQSLKSTYKYNPTFDKGMPSGYNAASWAAMIALTTGLDNTWKPDYNELDIIYNMLCGDPVADTDTAQQVTNSYGLALSGARDIATYTAQYGIASEAEEMRYSLLQSLDMTVTRGNAPAIDGNANLLFLKPGSENVRMSFGTNETQTITLTGTADSGTWTYTFDGITTEAIPFDATAGEVQTAFDLAFGDGSILVSGGPLGAAPLTTAMLGKYASASQALATVDDSLLGGATPALAVAQVTDGAEGDLTLAAAMPVLPQHVSVRRATTLVGLASALPLGSVHKLALSHSALANPFMFFEEGHITSNAHVDGDAPVHTLTVTMANDITGDCQTLKDDALKSPSQPSWWEFRAAHPDGVTQLRIQCYAAIGEPITKSAVDNVYSVDFPLTVLINSDLAVDGVDSIMKFIVTTKTA